MLLIKNFKHFTKQINTIQRCHSSRNILQLKERGMWQDIFPENSANEVKDLLNAAPQTVYAGMDPTAPSLHVGNLLVLVNLLHWQRGGHNVIALLGGATGRIGDPSGKNTEREKLLDDFVNENLISIKQNVEFIFENHNNHFAKNLKLGSLKIMNNEEWYNKMNPVQLLGNAGRYLRMGTLLSRTSVQTRLQSPAGMSLTEFSYQLFQAYDWFYLFEKYGCRFQVGGCDQMGNIMSGQELISKACKTQVYGLTLPLITTEMGDKLGKSAGNAVWLSSQKTSSFTFYQFWVRMSDAETDKMLHLFTFDSKGAIADLLRRHKAAPEKRVAQKHLAEQVTLLVHGQEGLNQALEATRVLYDGDVNALSTMNTAQVVELFKGAEIVEVLAEAGMNLIDFALKAGCFPTQADAVRIITAGGFYINLKRASNPNEVINYNVHRLANQLTLLRVGKKNYYIVKWL